MSDCFTFTTVFFFFEVVKKEHISKLYYINRQYLYQSKYLFDYDWEWTVRRLNGIFSTYQ